MDGNKVALKSEVTVNISPATLVPYFDPDTKLIYLSGKVRLSHTLALAKWLNSHPCLHILVQGDTTIIVYEYVSTEYPFLFEVTPFVCGSAHQVME